MSLKPFLRSIIPAFTSGWIKFKTWAARPAVKRNTRRLALGGAGAYVLFLLLWLIIRNSILNYAWQKATAALHSRGYELQCEQKGYSGLFTVEIKKLRVNYSRQAMFAADTARVGIAVWRSLWNGPSLDGLELYNTRIDLYRNARGCNFCRLNTAEKTETRREATPLYQKLFELLKRGLQKIPGKIVLSRFNASYADTAHTTAVIIPALTYKHNDLQGSISINEDGHLTGFKVAGNLNRNNIQGRLSLKPEGQKWVELPLLRRLLKSSAGFESVDFDLKSLEMDNGVLTLDAEGRLKGLTVNDRRLADTFVVVNDCTGKLLARLGKDFFEIDSATSLNLNKIKTHLFARADFGSKKEYSLKFKVDRMGAGAFFESLPEGMFRNLKGIEAAGELEYDLYAKLNDKNPDDCIFTSELRPYGFKIKKMGATNLQKMNGEFVHTFYERGRPVRSFAVGASNPAFTALDDIPELLQKAVMTGEDPAFFGHNGFYIEAIRQSIAQNYKAGRFARGGSTISMQLVKNVFLSRRKTLARKAEEILIVWLIESQRLSSKARMFEVYMNIIEWGPGVFGVGEASRFYFSKAPSELEPIECAFLASIVPMPKSYAYFIDSTGNISSRHWNFIAIRNVMIKRGEISEADSANFNLKLNGPALKGLRRYSDTLAPAQNDTDENSALPEKEPEAPLIYTKFE
jgi:hypothetical protein